MILAVHTANVQVAPPLFQKIFHAIHWWKFIDRKPSILTVCGKTVFPKGQTTAIKHIQTQMLNQKQQKRKNKREQKKRNVT